MKIYLGYGLGMGLAGAAWAIVLYLLGFHSDPAKLTLAQALGAVGGVGIGVAFITLGIKARRREVPPTEEFGYGQALGAGVMIALFSSLLGIVSSYVYLEFINPEFVDVIVQAQLDQLEAKHVPPAQAEAAEKIMRIMTKPLIQAAMSFVGGLMMGTVISLIAAAFLRRPAAPPDFAAPPVAG